MNTPHSSRQSILRGAMLAGVLLWASGAAAQTALTPNLKPLPASNFSLITDIDSTTLRFATTSWNNGTGPLKLEAGEVDTGSGKQQVYQWINNNNGTSSKFFAGWFEWHPTHNHFHFDDYADYVLQPIAAPGGSERFGQKTTFCVMDTTKVDGALPGAPTSAFYSTCGNQIQGMSVGWGDTYGAHLTGQEIDFSDNADGIYRLKIIVDPAKHIVESNESDNESCVLLDIQKPSKVTVLDSSGSCSTALSISPNTAKRGMSLRVSITGYGFTDGTTVTFEGGSGPRPVASNVVITSNTEGEDMLTATVTIPDKKQLGRNPVWDVRVGAGGLLRRAFTVTP
ncbi:MAG: hypothetical protein HP494_18470 [Nitrospira sp.]|nr:hypothetical protein [Nitrospira sp.]MBH0197518.1 hypothetical protein [Nitrospira sp.]